MRGFKDEEAHWNGQIVTLVSIEPSEDTDEAQRWQDPELWRVKGLDLDDPETLITVDSGQLIFVYEHDPNADDDIDTSGAQNDAANEFNAMSNTNRVAAIDKISEVKRDCAFENMPYSEEALTIEKEMMVSEAAGEAEWLAAKTASATGAETSAQAALLLNGSSPIGDDHIQTYKGGQIQHTPQNANKFNTSKMFEMHDAFKKHNCTLFSPTWRIATYREDNPELAPLVAVSSRTSGMSVLLQCNSEVRAIQGWGYDDVGSSADSLIEQNRIVSGPKNRVGACLKRGERTDSNGVPLSPIHGVLSGQKCLFSTTLDIPEAATIVKFFAIGTREDAKDEELFTWYGCAASIPQAEIDCRLEETRAQEIEQAEIRQEIKQAELRLEQFGDRLSAQCWECYLARYGDLQGAFGGDLTAAARHWFDHGPNPNPNPNPNCEALV